ncbi:MAG: MFS transporter [Acidobacteria bacterium]|nr:MFS transporter [Acidobacteriota bacterium]
MKAATINPPVVQKAEDPYPPIRYAWYVVGVLTFVYIFSFIDRQILNLLVGPIRRDLGISDTQMSLLMGFSFALFYTVCGIPLGWLADRYSRRSIIAVGFVFWSMMTAGCGLAQNFLQMLLMRMGVGVGEAALSPSAYSLISDYFPKEKRATAISIYSMGIYIGSGMAFLLGGMVVSLASKQGLWELPIVGQTRPWQVIFFMVGLPGALLALLMYTIREPVRRGLKMVQAADGSIKQAQVPFTEIFNYTLANWKTFICHTIGFALLSFSSYGSSAWIPTMYVRNFGWTASKAGIVYGLVVGIFATLGVATGGWVADKMAVRGYRDATMRVGFIVAIAWFPFGVLYPIVSNSTLSILLLIPSAFLASAPFGVAPAAIQQIMPNEMRGQASAIYLFVINLIGLGIGPTAVAMTTDFVFQNDKMVNWSLLIVCTIAHVVSGLLLWAGMKHFRDSLDRLKDWMKSTA